MASHRKIYWGLRDESEIPKMAACGDGTDPAGGGGAGGGGTGGSGRPVSYTHLRAHETV